MGTQKLLTAGGGGVQLTPASSIASDVTVQIPSANTTLVGNDTTQTLTNKTINGGPLQSATVVATTSGTSVDFTGIPSWVKRITVLTNGLSTSGSSIPLIRIGTSSGFDTTGYSGSTWSNNSGSVRANNEGHGIIQNLGSNTIINSVTNIIISNGNIWGIHSSAAYTDTPVVALGCTYKALSGTLDRIRLTTVNGTDTFDAGTINILYE